MRWIDVWMKAVLKTAPLKELLLVLCLQFRVIQPRALTVTDDGPTSVKRTKVSAPQQILLRRDDPEPDIAQAQTDVYNQRDEQKSGSDAGSLSRAISDHQYSA